MTTQPGAEGHSREGKCLCTTSCPPATPIKPGLRNCWRWGDELGSCWSAPVLGRSEVASFPATEHFPTARLFHVAAAGTAALRWHRISTSEFGLKPARPGDAEVYCRGGAHLDTTATLCCRPREERRIDPAGGQTAWALPDESGVPAAVTRAGCPNVRSADR
jgi:hypothetical protein